jgi:glycosyltransferase involved in cell wall biosynthesis
MPCRASFLPRSKRHSRVARDPTEGGRPRIIYVSYDGAGEPLGRSQVLGYLTRLASAYDITLISFEKADEARTRVHDELIEVGIDWIPMRYHRRPAVLSTMLDLLAGRRALIGAARRREPAIVHVRSYVPALMALLARRRTKGKLLFDIRGFWVDERVDGGLWRPGGLLYRVAKRCERRFYAEADAIVTLTQASVTQVRVWAGARPVPIQVIPTCVDLQRFARRPERPGGPHVVWIGSIGTWYRFDLTARLASALSLPLTVVTHQASLARRMLAGYPASVRSVAPDDVSSQLFAGDIGLCLIASSFSKIASAPTRFAEYLAAGMPTIATPGVGDLESLVEDHQVGVVLRGEDDRSVADAAERVRALAADHETRERCRRLALEQFDIDAGTARYADVYSRMIER